MKKPVRSLAALPTLVTLGNAFCGFLAVTYVLEALYAQSAGDDAAFRSILDRVIDHGQQEYIISVHWLKTALAVREEVEHAPAPLATRLVAALNRFLGSRQKRRQSVRTAYQSLQFVDRE